MDSVDFLRFLARELADSPDLPTVDVIEDDANPSLALEHVDGTRFFLVIDERISAFRGF